MSRFRVDHVYAYHHSYDIASAYGAMPTMRYMKKYGLSFEQMDETRYYVKKAVRMHVSLNPKAMIRQDLDALPRSKGYRNSYEFWKSKHNPFFAWPTWLLSALNTADSASAYVISGEAKKYDKKTPVEVKASLDHRQLPLVRHRLYHNAAGRNSVQGGIQEWQA